MDELNQIVPALNNNEIYHLRRLYKFQNNNMCLKLFDIVINNQRLRDEQAKKLLNKTSNISDSYFSQLKSKVKTNVFNIQLFHDNALKAPTNCLDAKFYCGRLILQSQLLISRNVCEQGIELLKKALIQAEKFKLENYRNEINDQIKYVRSDSVEKINAIERLFYRYLFNKNFEKAENIIDKYMDNPLLKLLNINHAKRQYFKACLLFVKGKFFESLKLSDHLKIPVKDKTDLKFACRLLTMLNYIELADEDLLFCKLECFRKLLDSSKYAEIESFQCINKILHTLCKEKLDYGKVFELNQKYINNLTHDNYCFGYHLHYSVIHFEKWLHGKVCDI